MCHMGRHWDMYVVTVSCAGQHSSGGTSIRAEVGNVADTVVVSVMGTTCTLSVRLLGGWSAPLACLLVPARASPNRRGPAAGLGVVPMARHMRGFLFTGAAARARPRDGMGAKGWKGGV
jgi:hypothetical protein